MSEEREHLHFTLNYAEEFRMRNELERLPKPPQRTVRQDSMEFRSNSPLSLMRGPALSQFNQRNSRPRSGVTSRLIQSTCQSPQVPNVPQDPVSDSSENGDQKVGRLSKSALSASRSTPQGPKDQKLLLTEQSSLHERFEEPGLRVPAIASMVGTTKPISVFTRPRPPAKLRSNLPAGSLKSHITVKPTAAQKKVSRTHKMTRAASTKIRKVVDERSTDSSNDSNSSSSESQDSDESEKRAQSRRKKKKKKYAKKTKVLATPAQDNADDVGKLSPISHLPNQLSEVIETSATHMNAELATPPQRAPEGAETTYLVPQVKATARSVDEIIASLRSPQTQSASDMMIKHLMESVLGLNYNFNFGKVPEEENETHKPQTESPVLGDQETSSAGPPQQSLLDSGADVTLSDDKLSIQLSSFTDTDDEDQALLQLSALSQEEPMTSPQEEEMTEEEAKQVLKSAAQITISDIIHVKGEAAPLTRRETAKTRPPVALLATWRPTAKTGEHQTIHHLCTVSPSHVLPRTMQLALRVCHTVDRRGHYTDLLQTGENDVCLPEEDVPSCDDSAHKIRILQDGVPPGTLPLHNQQGGVITLPPRSVHSLEEWQRIAEYYVEGPSMELIGEQAPLNSSTLKMFWTPAPPKFSAPLSLLQTTLFSKYESCLDEQEEAEGLLLTESESDSSDEVDVDPEELANLDRVLSRRHHSLPDISVPFSSVTLKKAFSASAPDISVCEESKFHLSSDFQTSMKELVMWRQQHYKSLQPATVHPVTTDEEPGASDVDLLPDDSSEIPLLAGNLGEMTNAEIRAVLKPTLKHAKKKKKTKKRKGQLDPKKLKMILQELNQAPRPITRSVSLESMSDALSSARRPRSSSLPCLLDVSLLQNTYGNVLAGQTFREWVRDIWNNWFDEVFPPSRASTEDEEQYLDIHGTIQEDCVKKEEVSWVAGLDSIPPILVEDPSANVQDVEREVSYLTSLIEKQERPSTFHYCRRGALHRKLGNLHLALQDLDMVIKHEPQLLDAYWHRHLIYLLQGKSDEALDDLNFIIKYNKTHADAYMSKAEIYKQKKDYTLAIVNYTQALKCKPTEDDIYFRRGQMYEAQDELIIAMDDYAQCFFHNPSRTDALMKHGLYYFENSNWSAAVQDFSALIKQDFSNVEARIYRGRAYTKLSRYTEAAEDFSAVIHLDPKNWMAFYFRGCLLRKCYPHQALQDFSIAVLLNDEFENLNAYLQRGILYTDLALWSEAAFDFERVLALDRTVAVAHVNLGLICLMHRGQYTQAVHQFSAAIKVDPLCIRAYLCRAQAYREQKDLQKALKDITRAIHLRPDSPEPYIIRGQYLYEMKRYDLASFCIHHAAEMTQGSSPVQHALVQSFRHQYNNAIECLVSASKEKPAPALIILLGKIQMKAKKNKDAAESFRKALELLQHLEERSSSSDRAEVFYLLGLCYMEQFKFLQALEALTSAVKARSGYCNAYYQRGLCRMGLQQANCVQDFNRALEIDPEHFQAYLCRAAFYGLKKRYSKAIMNCNAAIKVQPHSVRAYLYRGALKYYIKAYKLAIQDLSKAAELDPSCSLVYYNRGVCYHQINMYEKALKDYAIVLLLGGWKEADIKVLVNRGLLYLDLSDYANALEDFKAVARKTPGDIKIHQVIGDCHQRLQQYEKAVQAFDKVLQLNPLSPEGYIGRGNAYMEYGHNEGLKCAQADFVKALHLNPTCIAARICLGYNLQVPFKGVIRQY
ncbi:tetratricopeptide repeat protein 6 isoform X2 [Hyperolius riggenbachi]|uniref:tetratricopeptide repeat protein 6 isoform X2 n=1 Tax=Hyperolius riggenbachi TaxID=752182 RepID=UPI0035A29D8A